MYVLRVMGRVRGAKKLYALPFRAIDGGKSDSGTRAGCAKGRGARMPRYDPKWGAVQRSKGRGPLTEVVLDDAAIVLAHEHPRPVHR